MGAKKEQSSYTGKLQQLDLTISKQDFGICYCFFVEKKDLNHFMWLFNIMF